MAKIMVIQHVPYEPLGTLDPLIRSLKHRIRYINFARHPDANADLTGYAALIVLGGSMNVDQQDEYPFLATEIKLIQQALDLDIPILGICLGAQLIAHTLGAQIRPAAEKELGWYNLQVTDAAHGDPLMAHWQAEEKIFQWHGQTFDIPTATVPLVTGQPCPNQAFRYGDKVYGFQFHLEITQDLIDRWLHLKIYLDDLGDRAPALVEAIMQDTERYIEGSRRLSEKVFTAFLELIPAVERQHVFKSR